MNKVDITRNYTFRIRGGVKYESKYIRRFLNHVRTIKWKNGTSVYLRVSYGKKPDIFGKVRTFYNDGDYTNQREFEKGLKAFLES